MLTTIVDNVALLKSSLIFRPVQNLDEFLFTVDDVSNILFELSDTPFYLQQ